jgi:hypothetical protein
MSSINDNYSRCIANPASFRTNTVGCIENFGSKPKPSSPSSSPPPHHPYNYCKKKQPLLNCKLTQQAQREYDKQILPKIAEVAEELKRTGRKSAVFSELERTRIGGPSAPRLQGVLIRDRDVYPDMSFLTFNALDENKDGKLDRQELGEPIYNKLARQDGPLGSVRTDIQGMMAQGDLQNYQGITLRTWYALVDDRF